MPSAVIDLVLEGRPRDIGGFSVRRVLPAPMRRLVGPFIFFDHMGPAVFAPGDNGLGVRPHPHIALATITYLFDGEIVHKDSLGSDQAILPGDVNWMVAGRGIVHSERTSSDVRARGSKVHGLQTWVALPEAHEEMEPRFEHHPASSIPHLVRNGVDLRIIVGTAYGAMSPVGVVSPTLYVHARMNAGAELAVDDTHDERALYVADGAVECDGRIFEEGTMIVLTRGAQVDVRAARATNLMLVGGASLGGSRHIWWNFVSSSKERIEKAKADWRAGRFPKVPGDEIEFIPLPEN